MHLFVMYVYPSSPRAYSTPLLLPPRVDATSIRILGPLQHTFVMTLLDTPHTSITAPYTMADGLDRLVDDILIRIFQISSVHTVLTLRQTSRRFYFLSKFRCVWYALFCADVLACNLPMPGTPYPLSMLSAAELEQRTLRALHLERVWPRLSPETLVSKQHHHYSDIGRVDQVMFILGGTELLTVQGDKVVHWLVVSWPGFVQGLKHVGEWTPFEGLACRIVKNGDVPGVIAVAPRTQLGSHQSAKVASTSVKAPFVTLCHYGRVPGVVVGIWRHILLLDTTRELEGGGLELLDWHAQTTGTALLPRLSHLFGDFLDFVVFADHLLVVWECCVSVSPIPCVPADGQVVVEHKRVYMLQEGISRPVGFTTCVARRAGPSRLNPNVDFDQDTAWDMNMDKDWDGQSTQCASSALGMSPTLTIAARSKRRANSVSMVMLIPLVDGEGRERAATTGMSAFPYRLSYPPPRSPSPSEYANTRGVPEHGEEGMQSVGDYAPRACTNICLGWSGRGIFVVGRELRLVSPGLHILPPYDMQVGPIFEAGDPLYCLDKQPRQRGLSWLHMEESDADEGCASGDKVDFDEGMGRFVVAKERGGFEVVQLD